METATTLLEELTQKYFTAEDSLKKDINISFQQIAGYEHRLLQVVLQEEYNALTESIESYIEELKKGAN